MFAVAHGRRLALGRLPQRALPRGEAAARLGEPVPGARDAPSSARARTSSGRRSPRSSSRRSRSSRPWPPTGRSRSSASRASCSRSGSSACATGACTASFALWPSVIGEIRVSHLTPVLCLLAALAWRYRDATVRARRRDRPRRARSSSSSGRSACGWRRSAVERGGRDSPWPSPPHRSCSSCRSRGSTSTSASLLELGRTFDQESYNPYGFLVQSGAPSEVGRACDVRCSARRCSSAAGAGASLALAVAAALVALADRVAGLLRRRGGARSRPSGRGSRRSGSCRSRPGAC